MSLLSAGRSYGRDSESQALRQLTVELLRCLLPFDLGFFAFSELLVTLREKEMDLAEFR